MKTKKKKTAASAALVPVAQGGAAPVMPVSPRLVETARDFARAARAKRTVDAYAADWRAFSAWCEGQGLQPLPAGAAVVALYLTARAEQGRKVATLERALVAISQAHKAKGLPSPRGALEVQDVLRGIRRRLGVAPLQKAPALAGEVKAMVGALAPGLQGLRDRALLLVGFAGGFRRSELVALEVRDLSFQPEGLRVELRRSKTDQEGEGRPVGIPYGSTPETCPVRAARAWLEAAGVSEGRVFRSVNRWGKAGGSLTDRAVALVVKRAAQGAGLDATRYSGHSLRAGLATSAAKAGKSERAIMATTGHRSTAMVRRYIRDAELFSDNAAKGLL